MDTDVFLAVLTIIGIILIVAFCLGAYFLPTIIALIMHHPHKLAIFLINFFAGWTGVGWLGSLIWACIV